MNISIFSDETIEIDLEIILQNLNRIAPTLGFRKGKSRFSLNGEVISNPQTYKQLDNAIDKETSGDEEVLLFTQKPYDNNFFFDSSEKKVIISLSGWNHLTKLPRNNGVVFFICAILVRGLGIKETHKRNTGCINDFWKDKRGVDIGMRSAFICPMCLSIIQGKNNPRVEKMIQEIRAILDDLSTASRMNMNVCEFWSKNASTRLFDVFICHNSQDKDNARSMNNRLKINGIRTWMDEEQLRPGLPWQDNLEAQIPQIKAAAVLVGQSGIGPWQNREIKVFLQEFINRGCPVIPVILEDCPKVPQLPLFLSQMTWVDFRKNVPDPYEQLIWGITGNRQ